MKVGFVGAGKLGTPVALAMESKGHEVLVCDIASNWVVQEAYRTRRWPCLEEQIDELFDKSNIRCTTLEEVVRHAEVLFLAVQTPHDHRFGGSVPIPDERRDFDYKALIGATEQVVNALPEDHTKWPVLAVISTVLPGTIRRDIVPLLPEMLDFVYCPFFAAMGTVVRDVLDPEFVLAGVLDNEKPPERFTRLFNSLHDKEIISMSVESAELTKVSYNTFITNKIVIANTIMELAHKTGANCDSVSYALKRATDRIVSPSYMDGGVGDGGACVSGDTLVNTEFGKLTIKYLAEKNEKVKVWTCDVAKCDSKSFPLAYLSEAIEIRKTRTNQRLVRVSLAGGRYIDCTPDHKFLSQMTGVEAWDLNIQSSPLCLYSSEPTKGCDYTIERRVEKVTLLPGHHDVYCLSVPETGWFFANDILVKNCHPRDNIAMSWLAERVNLSSNVFDDLMYTREFQAEWLVDLARTEALRRKKSLVLLGKAYKPETNLVDGSCALLMADLLARQRMSFDHHDPFVDGATKSVIHGFPKVYLICTKHKCFANYEFPDGSLVIDPFGYIPERPNIELIAVGRCK